jgi:hypothetical protein
MRTVDDLLAAFRDDVVDTAEPQLWTDDEALRYLDEAQQLFCRLTGGLGDASTPEVTQLAYAAGATWVALHPAILKTRAAYRSDDGRALELLNYEDLAARHLRLDGARGPLRALVLGMEPGRARLYPVPNDAGTIQLLVDRLPLVELLAGTPDQPFEIASQHLPALLLWMKACAYAKQDAETFDQARASDYAGRFRAYCGQAMLERERAAHKTRVVAYGGL